MEESASLQPEPTVAQKLGVYVAELNNGYTVHFGYDGGYFYSSLPEVIQAIRDYLDSLEESENFAA